MPLSALEDSIATLTATIAIATWRLLALLAEFDRREGWAGWGIRGCAHWLNWRCGIDIGAAREKLRVAHALGGLPLINASFAAGQLSYSKVRAITQVATPANEEYLLMIARHGTAAHVERTVRAYRKVQRIEQTAAAAQEDLAADDADVSAETGASLWRGERMDLSLVVLGLLQADARMGPPRPPPA